METKQTMKKVRVYDEHGWPTTQRVPVTRYIYTDDEKLKIISEFLQEQTPVQTILDKYHISSKYVFMSWMDKLLKEKESLSLQEQINPSEPMADKSLEDRVKELEAENKRLQKALELEKLRSKALDTMINVAEETFNIPVRKKPGTKQ